AICLVSQNRMTPRRKLSPNLVHAARKGPDLQPAELISPAQQAIMELRVFGSWSAAGHNLGSCLLFQFDNVVCPRAFRRSNTTLDEGPVDLMNAALLKLFRQSLRCFRVAGKYYNAGDRTVQAMRNAQVDIPRFVIAFLEISLGQAFQRRDAWGDA